jgi:hypothetical protein
MKVLAFPSSIARLHRLTADCFHNARTCRSVELGLVIGKRGRDIPEASAMEHIGGA